MLVELQLLEDATTIGLAQVRQARVVGSLVADGALNGVGVVGHHLVQVAIAVLHQTVIASGTGAGLDLFADVALVLVSTLDHAGGFVLIQTQLDQRLNHGVASAFDDQRVLDLRVDWQHIAAHLAGVLTREVGLRCQVCARAKCALFAGLDAADGLSPLAAFGCGRAVEQAHGRLARLKELGKVGLALDSRQDVTVSEQLLEALCRALGDATSLHWCATLSHELQLLEASLTTLGHALGHSLR